MNNFKEFLEILKLPPSILSALMIVSGLVLILPEDVIKKLYMFEFRNNYGFAISIIFLVSLAILVVLIITICYLIEITRKITIKDDKLILSKMFSKKVEIYGNQIKGIYIYSFNKKFLKKRALTTKLVVVEKTDKFHKFTLSSLDNKAVLNMLKENFGVQNYKMYIEKRNKND